MSKKYQRNCNHCQKVYVGRGPKYCSRECSFRSPDRSANLSRSLKMKTGSGHSCWKGGKIDRSGYTYEWTRTGYKAAHRIVMESLIGRELLGQEVVHHCDEIKTNNSPENLILFRHKSAHNRVHRFALRHKIPVSLIRIDQSWLNVGAVDPMPFTI